MKKFLNTKILLSYGILQIASSVGVFLRLPSITKAVSVEVISAYGFWMTLSSIGLLLSGGSSNIARLEFLNSQKLVKISEAQKKVALTLTALAFSSMLFFIFVSQDLRIISLAIMTLMLAYSVSSNHFHGYTEAKNIFYIDNFVKSFGVIVSTVLTILLCGSDEFRSLNEYQQISILCLLLYFPQLLAATFARILVASNSKLERTATETKASGLLEVFYLLPPPLIYLVVLTPSTLFLTPKEIILVAISIKLAEVTLAKYSAFQTKIRNSLSTNRPDSIQVTRTLIKEIGWVLVLGVCLIVSGEQIVELLGITDAGNAKALLGFLVSTNAMFVLYSMLSTIMFQTVEQRKNRGLRNLSILLALFVPINFLMKSYSIFGVVLGFNLVLLTILIDSLRVARVKI